MLKIGNLGEGGQGLSDGHKGAGVTMKELFGAVREELDDVRTQYGALLVKLDADSGDTGGDSDYAASVGLAAATFEK